jgi:hypothetical protein
MARMIPIFLISANVGYSPCTSGRKEEREVGRKHSVRGKTQHVFSFFFPSSLLSLSEGNGEER